MSRKPSKRAMKRAESKRRYLAAVSFARDVRGYFKANGDILSKSEARGPGKSCAKAERNKKYHAGTWVLTRTP